MLKYISAISSWKESHSLPDGVNARFSPLAFHFRNRVPLKGEPPVKPSDHRLVYLHVKLKSVPVDGVDHRAHYGAGVLSNPKKKKTPFVSRKQGEGNRDKLFMTLGSECSKGSYRSDLGHLSSRGSIQPGTHSQWQSRNVRTSPVA